MSYPFDGRDGLIVLLAELFGISGSIVVRLALDTGATRTTINVGLLTTIGYDPSLVPDRIQITTGSGVEYAPRLSVSRINALGHERRGFPVIAHTLPPSASVDGLLGLDFSVARNSILTFALESSS